MPQDFTVGQVLTAAQMDTLSGAVDGYTTTVTSAGTLVLTTASMFQQFFSGSTTHTVTMPVTSTLYVGQKWRIVNNSSGVVTVQSSGANTIYAVPAGGDVIFTCILASGTTAASWDYKNYIATASSSPGLVFISAATFSAVASVSLPTNTFSATYTNYLIKLTLTACSSANDFAIRGRISGTDTATGYSYAQQQATTGSVASATGGTAADRMYMFGATTTDSIAGDINVFSPQTTDAMRLRYAGLGSGLSVLNGMGISPNATQYDSLTFLPSTGTCTGFYKVYGYSNS